MKKTEKLKKLEVAAETVYLQSPWFSCVAIQDAFANDFHGVVNQYKRFAGIDFDIPSEKFKDWDDLTYEERGTARSLCILMFKESLKRPVKK